MEIREVSIADVLRARDERVERQQQMRMRHHQPIISFSMNIAGPIKNDPWIERAFSEGVKRIEAVLAGRRVRILETAAVIAFTGCEQIWSVDADAHDLKNWMRVIEEQDALGRLFDIDVIDATGTKLSREGERLCLICGGPVRICARSRTHSVEEIFHKTHSIIKSHFRNEYIRRVAMIAEKSLLFELATTPKPGLVDFANSGAHSDMDRFTFISSACALRPFFETCAAIGAEMTDGNFSAAFERIRSAGQQAESTMLLATDGVNTHKGALFSLGILCCAGGMCFGLDLSADLLLERAKDLAAYALSDFERLSFERASTGGERQYLTSGLTGVRGEAAAGFPSVRTIALPALESALACGKSTNDACLSALIALMAIVPDSNVLRRAGDDGLKFMQDEARSAYNADPILLQEMDNRFIRANISPGGCADLLAVTWFLHEICK